MEGHYEDKIQVRKWRPVAHYTPSSGWINDPNGFVYFKGRYHLFYQYNPYSPHWDSMHWGHAVSENGQHWEECPCALFPDRPYDKDPKGGCFSGSVIVHDGRMYLFYTGSVTRGGQLVQSQCLAFSDDGVTFLKYENNPVIPAHPEGYGSAFRDPKVFHADGKWRMICGGSDGDADDPESHGVIYLYSSDDLLTWKYQGILYRSEICSMFECPDMFLLEGKWILTASPMNRPDFAPNIYLVGETDFERCTFTESSSGFMDYGTHYYAAQTYPDKNGELSTLAWLGGWPWMPWFRDHGPLEKEGFRGIITTFRRPFFDKERRLGWKPPMPYPAPEIDEAGERIICLPTTRSFSFSHIFPEGSYVTITLTEGDQEHVDFSINFESGQVTVDYSAADSYSRYGVRTAAFDPRATDGKLRIDRDGCVVTIIMGDGYMYYTTLIYPGSCLLGVIVNKTSAYETSQT